MSYRKRILLADDDPDFIEANRIVLQQNGYETSVAYDRREYLEKMASEHPDLVLLDVGMATHDDGANTADQTEYGEEANGIKLLVLAHPNGSTPPQGKDSDIATPVCALLSTPASPDRLVKEITGWVEAWSSQG